MAGSYTNFRGGRLIVWRGHEAPEADSHKAIAAEPGTILNIDESGIMVVCSGSSSLLIEEVQVEGKRRVSAREFANGARLKPGDRMKQDNC